jgi:hypothetical protein
MNSIAAMSNDFDPWLDGDPAYRPPYPGRVIEITDEIRAQDACSRAAREAAHRDQVTWRRPEPLREIVRPRARLTRVKQPAASSQQPAASKVSCRPLPSSSGHVRKPQHRPYPPLGPSQKPQRSSISMNSGNHYHSATNGPCSTRQWRLRPMRIANTHPKTCPAHPCTSLVPADLIVCRQHWLKLQPATRARVHKTLDAWQQGAVPVSAWTSARTAAIQEASR